MRCFFISTLTNNNTIKRNNKEINPLDKFLTYQIYSIMCIYYNAISVYIISAIYSQPGDFLGTRDDEGWGGKDAGLGKGLAWCELSLNNDCALMAERHDKAHYSWRACCWRHTSSSWVWDTTNLNRHQLVSQSYYTTTYRLD